MIDCATLRSNVVSVNHFIHKIVRQPIDESFSERELVRFRGEPVGLFLELPNVAVHPLRFGVPDPIIGLYRQLQRALINKCSEQVANHLKKRPSHVWVPLNTVDMGFVPIAGFSAEMSTNVDHLQEIRSPSTHLVRLVELQQLNQPPLKLINVGRSVVGFRSVVTGSPKISWVVNAVGNLKIDHIFKILQQSSTVLLTSHLLNAHANLQQLEMLRTHIVKRHAVPGWFRRRVGR